MQKKTKRGMLVLILLLAVGFAAVSTTLIINGTALFGTNTSDFDVIFTKAVLDTVDISDTVISEDGKTITYTTNELAIKGDKSVLDFEVTNNSTQYDASVEIVCEATGDHANEYYKVTSEVTETIVAKTTETGNVTVELIQTSVNEIEETFTCTIEATAVERETVAELYSLYGTLTDNEGNKLANTTIVAYSDPVYTVTDESGYFYIEGLERGNHTLYVMGSTPIEDLISLSESEIASQAATKADFATGNMDIVFENGYSLTEEIVELTKKAKITLDANGGSIETSTIELSVGNYYGELPIPINTNENLAFFGWYTDTSGREKIESNTVVTEDKTIYALWSENLYNLIATSADKTTTINFSQHSGISGTNGIYTTTNTDSGSEVYYYRGNVDNNLKFANFCWKMIRTTETGGVKLIYNGIPAEDGSCNNTGTASQIGISDFNSTRNDNAYVGYMYGTAGSSTYAETHANTNESTIKSESIDPWYLENIENKGYTKYLEDTIFCNDRNPVAGGNNNTLESDYGTLGYGTNVTGYGVLARAGYFTNILNPSLVCKNTQGSVPEDHDAFTVSEENGNGKLIYPVGLITSDEIVFAGFNTYSSNKSNHKNYNNYLYNVGKYWTLSPSMANGYGARIEVVQDNMAYHYYVDDEPGFGGVRPVISLASGTKITPDGRGTVTNPYVVVENK